MQHQVKIINICVVSVQMSRFIIEINKVLKTKKSSLNDRLGPSIFTFRSKPKRNSQVSFTSSVRLPLWAYQELWSTHVRPPATVTLSRAGGEMWSTTTPEWIIISVWIPAEEHQLWPQSSSRMRTSPSGTLVSSYWVYFLTLSNTE